MNDLLLSMSRAEVLALGIVIGWLVTGVAMGINSYRRAHRENNEVINEFARRHRHRSPEEIALLIQELNDLMNGRNAHNPLMMKHSDEG